MEESPCPKNKHNGLFLDVRNGTFHFIPWFKCFLKCPLLWRLIQQIPKIVRLCIPGNAIFILQVPIVYNDVFRGETSRRDAQKLLRTARKNVSPHSGGKYVSTSSSKKHVLSYLVKTNWECTATASKETNGKKNPSMNPIGQNPSMDRILGINQWILFVKINQWIRFVRISILGKWLG